MWHEKCYGFFGYPTMNASLDNETRTEAPTFDRMGRLASAERRKNPRVPLHWTLYLVCNGTVHRTTTRDINRDGFYCLLCQPIPITSGERIECDIVVPTHRSQDPDDVVYLRCRARALRVEKIGAGTEFGVACRIDGYCLIRNAERGCGLQETGMSSNGSLLDLSHFL